jgi:hypothetical protein
MKRETPMASRPRVLVVRALHIVALVRDCDGLKKSEPRESESCLAC